MTLHALVTHSHERLPTSAITANSRDGKALGMTPDGKPTVLTSSVQQALWALRLVCFDQELVRQQVQQHSSCLLKPLLHSVALVFSFLAFKKSFSMKLYRVWLPLPRVLTVPATCSSSRCLRPSTWQRTIVLPAVICCARCWPCHCTCVTPWTSSSRTRSSMPRGCSALPFVS